MNVPQFDVIRQYKELKTELLAASERVLSSGQYILGPEVEAFEKETSDYLKVPYTVGVASGTDALFLALKALGVGQGDKVVTTSFSFFATVSAILMTGATPVFVDIDPTSFNISPLCLKKFLKDSSKVKVIVPVHLYGYPADMDLIKSIAKEYSLAVVEDTAQAFGAVWDGKSAGTIGDLGCFSFFPTKNLGGFGDGGLIATSNEALASKLKGLRAHGSVKKFTHDTAGTNSRLDTLQAALLRVKLRHVASWIRKRREHAQVYSRMLAGFKEIQAPHETGKASHAFHQYTVRIDPKKRDFIKRHLEEKGIQTAIYYTIPLHLQPVLSSLGYRKGDFPESEKASQEVLSLPMFPELKREEVDHVAQTLLSSLKGSEAVST